MDSNVSKKLEEFFKNYKTREYKRRELLIKPERVPEGLFYLKKGIVREYTVSTKGEELTINIFKPNSLFPVAWIVNDSINSHYFEAMTAVDTFVAPKQNSLELFKKDQDVLFDLVKRIYRGLDGYFTRMEYLMAGTAESKLISELIIYAKRLGIQIGTEVKIDLKLTEKDLASQSGIARETVNREMQKLKKKDLIRFQNNTLIIKDLNKLEEQLINP